MRSPRRSSPSWTGCGRAPADEAYAFSDQERPGRDDLAVLYGSVGWTAYLADLDALERGVRGCIRVVTVRHMGR